MIAHPKGRSLARAIVNSKIGCDTRWVQHRRKIKKECSNSRAVHDQIKGMESPL